jgi:DNA-binding FadR family transcriptional regulator
MKELQNIQTAIKDLLLQRETFYRCNEDGSFSQVDLVNELYDDIFQLIQREKRKAKREVINEILEEANSLASWDRLKII